MNFRDKELIPYNGEEPFIFLSYSHRDAKAAEEIIRHMQRKGFRIWYDEGLTPGSEWDEKIAKKIKICGYFFALLSENYLASTNCINELKYACDNKRNCLLIYLDKVTLPDGIQLRVGTLRAVYRSRDPEVYFRELEDAERIDICREEGDISLLTPPPPPHPWKKIVAAIAAVVLIVLLLANGQAVIGTMKNLFSGSRGIQTSSPPTSSPSLPPPDNSETPTPTSSPSTSTQTPSPSPEKAPSKQDLDELKTNIIYPNEDCYLDHYRYATVAAPQGHSVNSYIGPDRSGNVVYVKNGEKVTVLAEQKGFSCVIIESTQDARWVTSDYLEPIESENQE